MKITLHDRNREINLGDLIDTYKLSVVEFELNIKQRDTTTEIVEYIKELCEQEIILAKYTKAVEYDYDLLIHLQNGIGVKRFLKISY